MVDNETASGPGPLHVHEWRTSETPRATVLILHGVCEHGGRYSRLAGSLTRVGLRVIAPDLRGHGRSVGRRCHVDRWSEYPADVDGVAAARCADAREPLFVFGHSMGALIAIELAMRATSSAAPGVRGVGGRPVTGWILSGAGIEPTGIAKPWLVAIAKLLSGIAPRVTLDLGIGAEALSHDPGVIEAYRSDPLVENRATVRWGTEALAALDRIRAGAAGIDAPVLILHGGADPLSKPEGSRWLAEAIGEGATLRIYDGALHEPHNDPAFADAATDIVAWVDERLDDAFEGSGR
ncbi:MAG: alpha/beta hydrolase [Gemmatimonadota bacterium]|nr:alpha/beta hydrolase [Gemmatimonadota bacterium]